MISIVLCTLLASLVQCLTLSLLLAVRAGGGFSAVVALVLSLNQYTYLLTLCNLQVTPVLTQDGRYLQVMAGTCWWHPSLLRAASIYRWRPSLLRTAGPAGYAHQPRGRRLLDETDAVPTVLTHTTLDGRAYWTPGALVSGRDRWEHGILGSARQKRSFKLCEKAFPKAVGRLQQPHLPENPRYEREDRLLQVLFL